MEVVAVDVQGGEFRKEEGESPGELRHSQQIVVQTDEHKAHMELGTGKVIDGQRVLDAEIQGGVKPGIVVPQLHPSQQKHGHCAPCQIGDPLGILLAGSQLYPGVFACSRQRQQDHHHGGNAVHRQRRAAQHCQCQEEGCKPQLRTGDPAPAENIGGHQEICTHRHACKAGGNGNLIEQGACHHIPDAAGRLHDDQSPQRHATGQGTLEPAQVCQIGQGQEHYPDEAVQQYSKLGGEIMPRQQVVGQEQGHHRRNAVVGVVLAVVEYMIPLGIHIVRRPGAPVIGVFHCKQPRIHRSLQAHLSGFKGIHQLPGDLVAGFSLEDLLDGAAGIRPHQAHASKAAHSGHHCCGCPYKQLLLVTGSAQQGTVNDAVPQQDQSQEYPHAQQGKPEGNIPVDDNVPHGNGVVILRQGEFHPEGAHLSGQLTGGKVGTGRILQQLHVHRIVPVLPVGFVGNIHDHAGGFGVIRQGRIHCQSTHRLIQILIGEQHLALPPDGKLILSGVIHKVPVFDGHIRQGQPPFRVIPHPQVKGIEVEHQQLHRRQHGNGAGSKPEHPAGGCRFAADPTDGQ